MVVSDGERQQQSEADGKALALRRVLVVAYYFPPISTSGAMRPLAFCRYLANYGWRPRVLAVDPASLNHPLAIDPALCSRLPPSVRVDRVGHANVLRTLAELRTRVRSYASRFGQRDAGAETSAQKAAGSASPGALSHLRDLGQLSLERMFAFPDSQASWRLPAIRRARTLPAEDRPDVVFATGGPWTSLLVGQSLARRFGVPLVTDFRDPWTRNPFKASRFETRARALERSVCASSYRVIANTPELRDQFVDDYPELRHKFVTITNGFDDAHSPAPDLENAPPVTSGAGMLELCHFGTLYGQRDPLPFLQALTDLLACDGVDAERLRVRFVGGWEVENNISNQLVETLASRGVVIREPPIPHDACLHAMRSAPMLLIMQPASPLQVPGKIYEYVQTGRPLLIIGGEGATANLAERHHLGRCCPNGVLEIRQLLRGLLAGETAVPRPSPSNVAQFRYRELTRQLATVLNQAAPIVEGSTKTLPLAG